SDIVSLHAPGGQTVVDAAWLAALQHPIVLVNTARPDLIDEDALAAAMRDGVVRAFAADTLQGDTAASSSPLLAADLADRVTVTPHFGAQTVEAVDGMGSIAVDNALAVLDGRVPPNPVR
ncbi:MAG: NAD(P)-dependent oxidoreductase, partial [Agrococcus casei]